MNNKELRAKIEIHKKWLNNEEGGERLDLSNTDLNSADLSNVDLSNANLSNANLIHANLRYADLSGTNLIHANLRYADLSGADLRYANLSDANLRYCVGNNKEVKSCKFEEYDIVYYSDILSIGCKTHSLKEWFNFSDEEILEMDDKKALVWWKKWKPILILMTEYKDAD